MTNYKYRFLNLATRSAAERCARVGRNF